MFPGCPLCNGVETPGVCPSCGSALEDLGMVENFYGPYSPYEERDSHTCVHLIYCPNCQNDFHQRETVGETASFYQHILNNGGTKRPTAWPHSPIHTEKPKAGACQKNQQIFS